MRKTLTTILLATLITSGVVMAANYKWQATNKDEPVISKETGEPTGEVKQVEIPEAERKITKTYETEIVIDVTEKLNKINQHKVDIISACVDINKEIDEFSEALQGVASKMVVPVKLICNEVK